MESPMVLKVRNKLKEVALQVTLSTIVGHWYDFHDEERQICQDYLEVLKVAWLPKPGAHLAVP